MQSFVPALLAELALRKHEASGETIQTIYFGGGTPSILSIDTLSKMIDTIYSNYKVDASPEITFEANPEHLTKEYLQALQTLPVNRLSIGVQSFSDKGLQWLGRSHNAITAKRAIMLAKEFGFANITADIIFGIPGVAVENDIEELLQFSLPHISAYAITVEPNTPLAVNINRMKLVAPSEEKVSDDFELVMQLLSAAGYEQYEISNYALSGYHSRHNTAYWQQKKYYGFGPSAHSYDGVARCWNVNNVLDYMQQVLLGFVPKTCEVITKEMAFNEYVMVSLRTSEGVQVSKLKQRFDCFFASKFQQSIQVHILNGNVLFDGVSYTLSKQGKLLADTVISDLFVV